MLSLVIQELFLNTFVVVVITRTKVFDNYIKSS